MKLNYIFLICIMLLTIFAIGVASASDVQSNDFNVSSQDVDCLGENTEADVVSENDENSLVQSADDSFKALEKEINNASDILILKHDYTYDLQSDNGPVLIIKDNFILDGDGHTIDAKSQAAIFNITGNNVTLKNITFVNGNATGNGGAVLARDLTVINSTFDSNFAQKGGAIYAENLLIYNSTFRENVALDGGALDTAYSNIINSTFVLNSAQYGGAILSDNINIVNSSFSKNSASTGGGIYSFYGLNVTGSIFEKNTAEIFGGGIYSGHVLNVTDSTFKENTAMEGGGFYANYANVMNSTFTKNTVRDGAGFRAYDADVFNSTFTQNTAGACGGGFMSTNANVVNSRFIQNTATEEHGGGIYSVDVLNVSNSYFEQNRAFYAGACAGMEMMNVTSSQFINNTAFIGGALFCEPAVIDDCIFENNSAQYGGAILASMQVNISNTKFRGNVAPGGGNEIVIGVESAILNNVTPDNILQVRWVQLYAQANNVYYSQTVKIETGILLGPDVVKVTGNVSCIINNRTYRANVVNGSAIIEIPNLEAGSYDCEVVFDGGEEYVRSSWNVSFEVSKRNATISAQDMEYVINYGGKYSVTVVNLVSNVKVTFVLNGKTVATATTQSGGVATFTLTDKMLKTAKAGKKDLVIKIDDANYNMASKTVKITINKEKTKITAKAKAFKRTLKTKKYTMALKNSKGKAMKNVKVYLKVKGKTYSAKTNSKGKATFKITKLTKKGTFKATITYKGNAYYLKATKKVTIKCK